MTTGVETALQRVALLAEQISRLRADMVAAVVAAKDAGCSLRDIAAAAGTSHESVRRLTQ